MCIVYHSRTFNNIMTTQNLQENAKIFCKKSLEKSLLENCDDAEEDSAVSEVAAVTSCDVGTTPSDVPSNSSNRRFTFPLWKVDSSPITTSICPLLGHGKFLAQNFYIYQVSLAWFELTQRQRFLKVDSSVHNFSYFSIWLPGLKRNDKKEKLEAILPQKSIMGSNVATFFPSQEGEMLDSSNSRGGRAGERRGWVVAKSRLWLSRGLNWAEVRRVGKREERPSQKHLHNLLLILLIVYSLWRIIGQIGKLMWMKMR